MIRVTAELARANIVHEKVEPDFVIDRFAKRAFLTAVLDVLSHLLRH